MNRPIESDYTSHVAYSRALEGYCAYIEQDRDKLALVHAERTVERDAYQVAADDCAAECKELRDGAEKIAARVLDANKAWGEYQTRQAILRVFEGDESK